MTERLKAQKAEIEAILEATGFSIETLAVRAIVKPETMRKYAKGYQPASDRLMQTLRAIASESALSEEPAEYRFSRGSTPRERLASALRSRRLTPSQLAKLIGYDAGVIEHVINGTGRASEKMIAAIARELPELTVEDLKDGADLPPVISDESLEGSHGSTSRIALPVGMKGRIVPLLSMAQAGGWDAGHSDDGWAGEGIFALNLDDRRAFAIRVSGNSMEPQIFEGDVVICSPRVELTQGCCAVIRTRSDQAFIKFWRKNGTHVVLESANKDYDPITFPIKEVAGAWPVVQMVRSGMITSQRI